MVWDKILGYAFYFYQLAVNTSASSALRSWHCLRSAAAFLKCCCRTSYLKTARARADLFWFKWKHSLILSTDDSFLSSSQRAKNCLQLRHAMLKRANYSFWVFRQTPPGPVLSLVAASDVEFSCAHTGAGVRKPWHPHARVRAKADQGNTKHGRGTQSRHCGTCAFISLMHLEKVLCGYSYTTGDVKAGFVFTSFHLWTNTPGLVSRTKPSCLRSRSRAAAELLPFLKFGLSRLAKNCGSF